MRVSRWLPDVIVSPLKWGLQYRDVFRVPRASIDHTAKVWRILSQDYGFSRSIAELRCVTAELKPLPWYTYPAIEYLLAFNFSTCRVFEYGAGASTLWWAERAQNVVSVESEADWVAQLKPRLPANAQIHHEGDRDRFIRAPDGMFEVIVIDGPPSHGAGARYACCEAMWPHLRPGGIVILDNSDWLPDTCAWLRAQGLLQIDFNGFSPINYHTGRTSVFLSLPSLIPYGLAQPPVGGIQLNWEAQ